MLSNSQMFYLTFMSMINFMYSLVELTSGPGINCKCEKQGVKQASKFGNFCNGLIFTKLRRSDVL